MKPYALSDLMVQVSNMGELKRTAPSSKVKALYRIAHESVMQAELEYLDLLRRLEEGSKTQMLKTVGMEFWNTAASGRKGTRAADIVELWDFCGA